MNQRQPLQPRPRTRTRYEEPAAVHPAVVALLHRALQQLRRDTATQRRRQDRYTRKYTMEIDV